LLDKFWNGIDKVNLVTAFSKPRRIGSRPPAYIQHNGGRFDKSPVDYFFRPKELKLRDTVLEPVTLRRRRIVGQDFG
jgi:hypothetical protein